MQFLSVLLLSVLPIALASPPRGDCPSNQGKIALPKRFFESVFEQPQRNHTSDAENFYDPNINVYDFTKDYPSPIRGLKYPVRGKYAWNREVFLKEVEWHFPWPYYGIVSAPVSLSLTNTQGPINQPCYIDSEFTVSGSLLRDYGGRKKGDPVTVYVAAHLDLVGATDYIKKVNYTIDWKDWYAALPPQ